MDDYIPFPSAEFMKSFKFQEEQEGHETITDSEAHIEQLAALPSPEHCIIKFVLAQLAVSNMIVNNHLNSIIIVENLIILIKML